LDNFGGPASSRRNDRPAGHHRFDDDPPQWFSRNGSVDDQVHGGHQFGYVITETKEVHTTGEVRLRGALS
jgi:hypothetical protein